jgi:SAM-dependent methyltransferase
VKNCYVCKNSGNNKTHVAREMMFGWRDEFTYIECGNCGTLQIAEIPDLSRYYPANYYSFEQVIRNTDNSFLTKLKAKAVGNYFGNKQNIIGKYLSKRKGWDKKFFPISVCEVNLDINSDSKILDFGCGNGNRLLDLNWFGFNNLTGIDEFIASDIIHNKNVRVLKRKISEIDEQFDLITANHSVEHLPDPREILGEFHRLLKPQRLALIRIPLISKAWETYGIDWVQLDAPRHLFLFTEKSFRQLAENTGFTVEKVLYDSDEFQFYASEQYKLDIPLNDKKAYDGDIEKSIFTQVQIDNWKREAEILNANNEGDQACFYLRK